MSGRAVPGASAPRVTRQDAPSCEFSRGVAPEGGGGARLHSRASVRATPLLACALLLASSAEGAEPKGFSFYTGTRLIETCKVDQTLCTAYVAGVSDTHGNLRSSSTTRLFCAPEGATDVQFRLVAEKWLGEHPEMLHFGAAGLVLQALHEAFSCGKKQ